MDPGDEVLVLEPTQGRVIRGEPSLGQCNCAKSRKEMRQPLSLDFDLVAVTDPAIAQFEANLGRGQTGPRSGIDCDNILGCCVTSAGRNQQE